MADDLPFSKISISGPTLSSILQRFASSPGDVDGLLFGHITCLPPPDLHDDDPTSLPSPSPLAATITNYFCSGSPMSFYDSLGRIDFPSLHRLTRSDHRPPNSSLIGWFSARRRSPLRPSMRELAVSSNLSTTLTLKTQDDNPNPRSCIFLLLSSFSTANQAVHTHEYRAFTFRSKSSGGSLEARSLDVVNVGPAFRGQYGSFAPESAFPWMPCPARVFEEGGREREIENQNSSLNGRRQAAMEQRLLDFSVEGFGVERLEGLVGSQPAEYTKELEDLYGKMLVKLEGLARLVEKSSARVLEQENRNLMLRSKIAGLE